MNYHDLLENSRIENKDLDKKIAVLKTEVSEKEKQIGQLTGFLKIREDDLRNATKEISNQSKKITDIVLQKFNEIKIKIIQELIDEKVQLIRENLRKKKDEELLGIFEGLGVSKERVIEIIKKRG
jgi:predicted  nucleic acid-binding Zn-ribbon protein